MTHLWHRYCAIGLTLHPEKRMQRSTGQQALHAPWSKKNITPGMQYTRAAQSVQPRLIVVMPEAEPIIVLSDKKGSHAIS